MKKKLRFLLLLMLSLFIFTSCSTPFSESANNVVSYETINNIQTNYIKAHTRITMKSLTSTGVGSGVIFAEDTNYYYVLTNNHVVYCESIHDVTVTDCYGEVHKATVMSTSNNYDLALLKFTKTFTKELKVLTLSSEDAQANTPVCSFQEPNTLNNIITYGKILGYKTFVPIASSINKSNVTFDVIVHNSPIDSGASGGALIDFNGNLVGINFASATTEDDEFIRAYAIPSSKVKEYLKGINFIQ